MASIQPISQPNYIRNMASALNVIGDKIAIIDTDYNVIFENTKCIERHGSKLNQKCYYSYSQSDTICDGCPAQEVFKTGKIVTKEIHTPLPDIEAPTVEIVASPIRNDKGEIIACLEVVRDLSERVKAEREKQILIEKLECALKEIKVLQGIIPICSVCKKLKDSEGYWQRVDEYLSEHTEATFSHGLCLECSDEMYKDEEWYAKIRDKLTGSGK